MEVTFDMSYRMSIVRAMDDQNKKKRLSRDTWLQTALEVLAKEGRARLRLEHIAQKLGVTTGSFYWHFKNREDFVISLAEYWANWSTEQATKFVSEKGGDAADQLMNLMKFVLENDLGRYDIVMRSWALHEPQVNQVVKKVDHIRLLFVRRLFSQMGFEGDELEVRSQIFASYLSLEKGFLATVRRTGKKTLLKQMHTFFTTK